MQVPVLTVYRAGKAVEIDPSAIDLWTGNGWGLKPTAPVVEPVAVDVDPVAFAVEPEPPAPAKAGRRGK